MRKLAVYRALNAPNLIFGCERYPFFFVGTLALALISRFTWTTIFLGALLWALGIGALRQMAKADPHMFLIYIRYARYRSFYSSRSTAWRKR